MAIDPQTTPKHLYETDFALWIATTVQQLRAGAYEGVDWGNLIEEIEDMSRRERQSLQSNLIVVLLHLLKWQYQPEKRSGSWRGSLREHRRRIGEDLKTSSSLLPCARELYRKVSAECCTLTQLHAANDTDLPLGSSPPLRPFACEQALDAAYLPA